MDSEERMVCREQLTAKSSEKGKLKVNFYSADSRSSCLSVAPRFEHVTSAASFIIGNIT